jgi:hypothetical protein
MSRQRPGQSGQRRHLGMSRWPVSKLCDNIALVSAFLQPTIASATSVGPFARAGSGALIIHRSFFTAASASLLECAASDGPSSCPTPACVLPGCFTIGSAPPLSAEPCPLGSNLLKLLLAPSIHHPLTCVSVTVRPAPYGPSETLQAVDHIALDVHRRPGQSEPAPPRYVLLAGPVSSFIVTIVTLDVRVGAPGSQASAASVW